MVVEDYFLLIWTMAYITLSSEAVSHFNRSLTSDYSCISTSSAIIEICFHVDTNKIAHTSVC